MFGVRQRGREIAGALLTGVLADRLHGVLDHRAFLVLVHAVGVARVVDAVTEELPVAFPAQLDDLRVVIAQRRADSEIEPRTPYLSSTRIIRMWPTRLP